MGGPGVYYANEISQRIQTLYDFTYMYVESKKAKHINKGGKTETDLQRTNRGWPEGREFGEQVEEVRETKWSRHPVTE